MVERERLLLPDPALSRPALVLAQRFVQRWDLYAHQLDDGSYVCVHEQLNMGHLAKALAREVVPSHLEASRRGGHLWLFLAEAVTGQEVRAFGHGLLAAHDIEGVELYPKQDQLADGPGSLIRMPFGLHRLTGRRYGFYTADESPLAPTVREQICALKTPETIPEAAFEAYRSFVPPRQAAVSTEPPEELTGALSERIKASVKVLEFVS
jgi:hypothetical protein